MIDFKPLDFEAKKIYDEFEKLYGYVNMEHNFTVMYVWQEHMDIHYAVVDDALVLMTKHPQFTPFFVQPLHRDKAAPIAPLVDKLEVIARDYGFPFSLRGVSLEYAERLEAESPGRFVFTDDVDYYEYVYLTDDLINLRGKKFSQKRNHINNFDKEHTYRYIPYDDDYFENVLLLDFEWGYDHGLDWSYEHELRAIRRAIEYRHELNVRGGLIEVDGVLCAFSFGAPTGPDMFTVLFEKAKPGVNGLYQIINREFASHEAAGFKYTNRQEDLGIPGLRHAKRSYNPAFMVEKKVVELRH